MACGCGRSPTGQCMGWHSLSEDEYRQKLAEYEANKLQEDVAASKEKQDES